MLNNGSAGVRLRFAIVLAAVSIAGAMMLVGIVVARAAWQEAVPGTIEITTQVMPTGGRPEPAMRFPLYLLRKSLADILNEAEKGEPELDLDEFIAKLEVSEPLRAWMKRTRIVRLSGQEFVQKVTPNDVFDVPEFLDAYLMRNMNDVVVGFPKPKYKESDRQNDPRKYELERRKYLDEVRKFLEPNRYSIEGIEVHLTQIHAAQDWDKVQKDRLQRIRRKQMEYAQLRDLIAKTETDMKGRAMLNSIPPGRYWLTSLDSIAIAGDARLRWDTPVEVRAGQVTRIELNNLNAEPTTTASR